MVTTYSQNKTLSEWYDQVLNATDKQAFLRNTVETALKKTLNAHPEHARNTRCFLLVPSFAITEWDEAGAMPAAVPDAEGSVDNNMWIEPPYSEAEKAPSDRAVALRWLPSTSIRTGFGQHALALSGALRNQLQTAFPSATAQTDWFAALGPMTATERKDSLRRHVGTAIAAAAQSVPKDAAEVTCFFLVPDTSSWEGITAALAATSID
ncbi:hypothetical protein Q5752_003300 [Cryptotrichosporon argae]